MYCLSTTSTAQWIEIFKYEDFLKWVDDWKENTSGLLFLRYIQKLVLQEIDERGERVVHLEITTKNSVEIHKYSETIQDGFSLAAHLVLSVHHERPAS